MFSEAKPEPAVDLPTAEEPVKEKRWRLRDVIEAWKQAPLYEGVRGVEPEDIERLDPGTEIKIETILEAMEWPHLIIFRYGESDRVVAPFVIGISSEGNFLMRGYQIEGVSRSGRGGGWRVFQISKMEEVANHWDFFDADEFDFEELYPWTYKVVYMLAGRA